ncbi:uncharacterized protein UV8b_05579 [Ustilaginoidea virens]|uniref:Uncharacterized protein n=1 Tax=Ustilaginoidea virens TaxID=1159556 RepID=A0A8E5MJ15_USTVR|nr:uncharacterized protein UV8b_05579 [Ustilaginoidea virens]QUC21336.1 hypothetical protein UV8b_05579 [Ustilaginoidea virens]
MPRSFSSGWNVNPTPTKDQVGKYGASLPNCAPVNCALLGIGNFPHGVGALPRSQTSFTSAETSRTPKAETP